MDIEQTPAGDLENAAITQAQGAERAARRAGKVPIRGPFGRPLTLSPHVQARYNPARMAKILGNPENIVSADFKRRHPQHRYEFPIEKTGDTTNRLNNELYIAVKYDDLDKSQDLADLMKSPEGNVIWKQHILVAVSPHVWQAEKAGAEYEAIRQLGMSRQMAEEQLNAAARAGFKVEVEQRDKREEDIFAPPTTDSV